MASPDRLTAHGAALLVVDLQPRLLAKVLGGPRVVANAARLLDAATLLRIPAVATEQYPQGLGASVPEIAGRVPDRIAKTAFHAADAVADALRRPATRHVTLAGIEAHVCIAQTAIELLDRGFRVQVPADAVGSRSREDFDYALRRLERLGVVVTTTEAALFEWAERSDRPEFKAISALVKDFIPPA